MSGTRLHYRSNFFSLLLCLLLCVLMSVESVDRNKFKRCDQSHFCKRNRVLSKQFNLNESYTVGDVQRITESSFLAHLYHPTLKDRSLILELSAIKGSIVHLTIDESKDTNRFRGASEVVLKPGIEEVPLLEKEVSNEKYVFSISPNIFVHLYLSPFALDIFDSETLILQANHRGLFHFEYLRTKDADTLPSEIVLPDAEKPENWDDDQDGPWEAPKISNPDIEGRWEEVFDSHRDLKPNGPESIGMDFSFVGASHVYGIPEHTSNFALEPTVRYYRSSSTTEKDLAQNQSNHHHQQQQQQYQEQQEEILSEPYRLYNLDVFEYELNSKMALYGSVPLMLSHSIERTTGIFWLNPSETWIDISESPTIDKRNVGESEMNGHQENNHNNNNNNKENLVGNIDSHWFSESGIVDVFFLLGPTPADVFMQYSSLTGTTPLPPLFSLAYHQCKWNYRDENEVEEIDSGFDQHNIPYDVIWLDIEYTDAKKYFTWDPQHFPNPRQMQEKLDGKGRKLVTIIDPHIKREPNYAIHTAAQYHGFYVKNRDGNEYEGQCWPGSSSWIDYWNPAASRWWSERFLYSNFEHSNPNLFIWNDMNEPSVFSGPEVTMSKDAVHYGGVEHRNLHNLYGLLMHRATTEGLIERDALTTAARPFVLSRSFFAGSQRMGAAFWTGDNAAQWEHLAAAQPMLLALSVAGLPFCGSDIGGFFGNPDAELLTRWYQAAAFHPFFREHAHIDSKRREPWLFGEPYVSYMRTAIRMRYSLLPYWYTLFYQHSLTGIPVIRPLWVEFPTESAIFAEQDQFMLGSDLLVKPITKPGILQSEIYFPGSKQLQLWYDLIEWKVYNASALTNSRELVESPLSKMLVFQRGGSILPKKERPRRASKQMQDDPFTLMIALDNEKRAKGVLYLDDGYSFNYRNGQFSFRRFHFSGNQLRCTPATKAAKTSDTLNISGSSVSNNLVERIVILGLDKSPTRIYFQETLSGPKTELNFFYQEERLIIRKPNIEIAKDWIITLA